MYVNTTQAASLLKISPSRLRQLLQKGRVRGAYKTGKYWLIRLYDGMPYVEETKRGQAGTWKVAKKPQKTTVNINSNIIWTLDKQQKCSRTSITNFFSIISCQSEWIRPQSVVMVLTFSLFSLF